MNNIEKDVVPEAFWERDDVRIALKDGFSKTVLRLIYEGIGWFKDGNFWRHPGSSNAGDLIFNTMARIIDMEDTSDWAHASFDECKQLLSEDKRWPDRLTQEDTAKSMLQYRWVRFLYRLNLRKLRYSRPQDGMTRDPYVATITCALHLGRPEEISAITIPWTSYSRATWLWRRILIKDKQSMWVQRLDYYRALSVVIKNGSNPNIVANKEDIEDET